MYELIYTDSRNEYEEMRSDIRSAFPGLRIEDASDFVHEFRFSVEGDVAEDDWWPWAITKGVFMATLGGNLMMHAEPNRVRGYMATVNDQAQFRA
jgi:hypothetical protein